MDHLGWARIKIDGFTIIARRYFKGKDNSSELQEYSGMLGDIWYDDILIFPTLKFPMFYNLVPSVRLIFDSKIFLFKFLKYLVFSSHLFHFLLVLSSQFFYGFKFPFSLSLNP